MIKPSCEADTKLYTFYGSSDDNLANVLHQVAYFCEENELSPDDVMSITLQYCDGGEGERITVSICV